MSDKLEIIEGRAWCMVRKEVTGEIRDKFNPSCSGLSYPVFSFFLFFVTFFCVVG